MEVLKKKKIAQRAAVTKASNAVSGFLDQANPGMGELSSAFPIFEQEVDLLSATVSDVYDLMYADDNVTADQIEKETDDAEAENDDEVIASLKAPYRCDDLQIEVYVRELLQLVLQNAIKEGQNGPVEPLLSLYDKLESHLRSLESFGVTMDKCAAMLLPLVESSLPEELLRVWRRSTVGATQSDQSTPESFSKDRLTRLFKFFDGGVQNELRISMAVKGLT